MWHSKLTKEQRIETLNQLALSTGYAPFAIEKDWWVCMVLRAVFQSKYKGQIIFKGGTSLSKAYQIIERFSDYVFCSRLGIYIIGGIFFESQRFFFYLLYM